MTAAGDVLTDPCKPCGPGTYSRATHPDLFRPTETFSRRWSRWVNSLLKACMELLCEKAALTYSVTGLAYKSCQ